MAERALSSPLTVWEEAFLIFLLHSERRLSRPTPSPWGLPPPTRHSVWQRRHTVRGIQQICKLWACWKQSTLQCALFSQLLPEQRQRQLECKHRDRSLIPFAKPSCTFLLSLQFQPCCTPATSNSMRTSSIIYSSLQTLTASQLFSLKFRNPLCLPLTAPLPRLNEHSWFVTGFYCSYINNILGYNTICCAREKRLLKMQSLMQSIISSFIHVSL